MDIFEKCYAPSLAKELKEAGVYPYFHALQSRQDVEVQMEGKRRIMLGSNNYLGLTIAPDVVEAGIHALERYGTGCSGSRFLNGTLEMHLELEAELGKFLRKPGIVTFGTGYQSNVGIISALVDRHDYVICDRENHASIYAGCQMSYGKMLRYRHSDMADLEKQLQRVPEQNGALIVTDGTTLLGADDKAGVAEIMAAVETMIEKNVKHGEVRVIFTTDEEIGNGVDGLDVQELGCDYGYTVDGGPLGEIEFENFNAASAVLTVHGVGVHPGSAKNVMINAATAAMAFHAMLPEDEVPEKTDGYEGFFHLTEMSGSVTEATLRYIIRDHDRERFEEKKALFADCAARINEIYGDGTAEAQIKDSYYNMKEKILPHFHLIERAENAFRANGVEPQCVPIRGGTDGARLSWDGLPCPNLSTGGYNYHGVREWIPADSLEAMTNVLVTLTESFAE